MSSPLVSIVVPSYNHSDYVLETIDSIVRQSYENIELIVIDDGSRDDSVKKIQELASLCTDRFKRFEFRTRENRGLCATLNEALEWSRGEYFSLIASDDVMLASKTFDQVEYMQTHPDCSGVFGLVQILGTSTRSIKSRERRVKTYRFKDIFLHRHNLPAPTPMLRRKDLIDVGGYASGVTIEDWYMWLLITSSSDRKFALINEVVCLYRRHANNSSANIDFMHLGRLDVLQRFHGLNDYSLAKANCYLASAFEVLPISKKKSMRFFIKGFFMSPMFFLQIRVWKYLFLMLVRY